MRDAYRWSVSDLDNLNAVLPANQARGIYVLEFENGERYVGKATDVASRLYQHRRDTLHHPAWTDITAVQFRPIAKGDLSEPEREQIAAQRNKHTLRNRVHNLGHNQSSTLDEVIDPEFQKTWLDAVELNVDSVRTRAASRIGRHARATNSAYGDEIIDDLATLIELFIPAPVETEGRFWSLTDWPNAVGGRAFTLNIGGVELAYCSRPRAADTLRPIVSVNAPAGSFTAGIPARGTGRFWLRKPPPMPPTNVPGQPAIVDRVRYGSLDETNRLRTPAGTLLHIMSAVNTPQQSAEDIRAMSLAVMRQKASPWAKSHSNSLATMAFRTIAAREQPIQLLERGPQY